MKESINSMNLVLFATPSLTPIFFLGGVCNFDNWLKEKSSAKAWNTSTVTTKGMLFSQNPTDIIMHFFISFNPKTVHLYNITKYKGTFYFPNNKNLETKQKSSNKKY